MGFVEIVAHFVGEINDVELLVGESLVGERVLTVAVKIEWLA